MYSLSNLLIFLQLIPEPNLTACRKILEDESVRFTLAPGSSHNHQAWEGGYIDHVVETMIIAGTIYEPLNLKRKLPFSLGDVILCLFLHDIEKPWKYISSNIDLSTKEKRHAFRRELISKYEIQLTDEHWNGVEYAEGEIQNYSSKERYMCRLAAFVHMCDIWSARGWYDEPSEK